MWLLEKLQRLKIIDGLLVLGFLMVIMGIGMNFREQFLDNSKTEIVTTKITSEIKNDIQVYSKVMIDVGGEVINPGVYEMEKDSRVEDVLIKSGGLDANADRDWVDKNLNKAEKVYDGQKIYIPKTGEILGTSRDVLQNVSTNKIIHINVATVEELDKLDGVGPAMANRIIDYRIKMGGFKTVEEIKLVPGIGDKMFEKIKDEIQL